jgi:hypothetical protein
LSFFELIQLPDILAGGAGTAQLIARERLAGIAGQCMQDDELFALFCKAAGPGSLGLFGFQWLYGQGEAEGLWKRVPGPQGVGAVCESGLIYREYAANRTGSIEAVPITTGDWPSKFLAEFVPKVQIVLEDPSGRRALSCCYSFFGKFMPQMPDDCWMNLVAFTMEVMTLRFDDPVILNGVFCYFLPACVNKIPPKSDDMYAVTEGLFVASLSFLFSSDVNIMAGDWSRVIEYAFAFHRSLTKRFYDWTTTLIRKCFQELGMSEDFGTRYIHSLEHDQRLGLIECRVLFDELLHSCRRMI